VWFCMLCNISAWCANLCYVCYLRVVSYCSTTVIGKTHLHSNINNNNNNTNNNINNKSK
jgi:hypothetical protein